MTGIKSTVYGIDVSHHNGLIDWQQVSRSGHSFAFIKCTEGATFVDPMFESNAAGAATAGLWAGAYHFFSLNSDGKQQADAFLSATNSCQLELPLVIDVEVVPSRGDTERTVADLRVLSDEIRARTGMLPVIYTNRRYWGLLGNPTGFEANDLWVAHWEVSEPTLPVGWNDYLIWQYTDSGEVPGISTDVDLNQMTIESQRPAFKSVEPKRRQRIQRLSRAT